MLCGCFGKASSYKAAPVAASGNNSNNNSNNNLLDDNKNIPAPKMTAKARSMSVSGNLVKEYDENVWDFYDNLNHTLGKGAGGQVVLAASKDTKREYAIKIITITDPKYLDIINNEKYILEDLDHPNCVRLYEVYTLDVSQMWFVMEVCKGGHLGQFIASRSSGYMREETARTYVTQLLSVVAHLHERKICHRDIKLANILMERKSKTSDLKLIDFGNSSRFNESTLMTRIAGTTYTSAPEVFKRKGYNEKCDVWSIGVMAYIMLCGRRPFERIDIPNQPEASEASLISSIITRRFHFNHLPFERVTDEAIHFICSCFEANPTKRPSALSLMKHGWISRNPQLDDISSSNNYSVSLVGDRNVLKSTETTQLNMPTIEQQMQYAQKSDFNRTSMLGVAFSIRPEQTRLLRTLFNEMDTDKTGFIDRTEFINGVARASGSTDAASVSELFNMIDMDGNNVISFIEFLAATIDPRAVDIQDLNRGFKLLDKENKGYITAVDLYGILDTTPDRQEKPAKANTEGKKKVEEANVETSGLDTAQGDERSDERSGTDELKQVLVDQHMHHLKEHVANMIKQVDIDGDGKISYSEYLFAMSEMPKISDFVPCTKDTVLEDEQMDKINTQKLKIKRRVSESEILSHLTQKPFDAGSSKHHLSRNKSNASETGVMSSFFSKLSRKKLDVDPKINGQPETSKQIVSTTSYFGANKTRISNSKIHVEWTAAAKEKVDERNNVKNTAMQIRSAPPAVSLSKSKSFKK